MDLQELSRLSPGEIYNAYSEQIDPETLLAQGKANTTHRLIQANRLDEQAASYAAEQMLVYAQDLIDSRSTGLPPDEKAMEQGLG